MNLQTEQQLHCPYCGERISIVVDHSVAEQAYIEDCEVCCRPIEFTCRIDTEGAAILTANRGDD